MTRRLSRSVRYGRAVDLDALLLKTSRTFALAIPLLPQPTRRSVAIAYLLFRIADTFEDATAWPRGDRMDALKRFSALLTLPPAERDARVDALVERCRLAPPVTHEGYLELLAQQRAVVRELDAMAPGVRDIIIKHMQRTADGMARVVERADDHGNLRLTSLSDLKEYCYIVAGIVGELLTEVFCHDTPMLKREQATLMRTQVAFGEGLQLVNILKDASDDAREGRVYLPEQPPRSAVFELARADLDAAAEYVLALQRGGAPDGYLGFTGLSLSLAFASLDRLERDGAGAKVSRFEVAKLFTQLQADIAKKSKLDLRRRVS